MVSRRDSTTRESTHIDELDDVIDDEINVAEPSACAVVGNATGEKRHLLKRIRDAGYGVVDSVWNNWSGYIVVAPGTNTNVVRRAFITFEDLQEFIGTFGLDILGGDEPRSVGTETTLQASFQPTGVARVRLGDLMTVDEFLAMSEEEAKLGPPVRVRKPSRMINDPEKVCVDEVFGIREWGLEIYNHRTSTDYVVIAYTRDNHDMIAGFDSYDDVEIFARAIDDGMTVIEGKHAVQEARAVNPKRSLVRRIKAAGLEIFFADWGGYIIVAPGVRETAIWSFKNFESLKEFTDVFGVAKC